LRSRKRGPDRSSTNKYLSFGEKVVKIDAVDLAIIGLREIIREKSKRKELIQAKYIALLASLPSRLTSGSAMAEGPRDALVSRNSATTKHPI